MLFDNNTYLLKKSFESDLRESNLFSAGRDLIFNKKNNKDEV